MRTAVTIGVLLGVLVITAQADEFYLKHQPSGKVYGPYTTDEGAKVVIGKATFTVVKKTSALEKKLGTMSIPQVVFRAAALQDALEFLADQTRMLDPKRTGVNFVIAKMPSPTKKADALPKVTLSLKKVSALQVLTGCTYKTSGNTVTIYPKRRK